MNIMDDWGDIKNAEGNCKKCGADLGIDGRCIICAINDEDFQAMMKRINTCPICGMQKTHHRLYGYRCDNPEHAAMEEEMIMKGIRKP